MTNSHVISKFFVTCFSGEEDDLTQWDRYGQSEWLRNRVLCSGATARAHQHALFRVVYDALKHEAAAKQLADATVRFYLEGLDEVSV